jgi:hypothetical protein
MRNLKFEIYPASLRFRLHFITPGQKWERGDVKWERRKQKAESRKKQERWEMNNYFRQNAFFL